MEIARALCFVAPTGDEGPILFAEGGLAEEISMAGSDISDHEMPCPDGIRGLLIFEGWMEYTAGPDPDLCFVGEWRRLTHWEMCRVRHGLSPFERPMESE